MTRKHPPGALSGLRVIDLSRVLAGPYAAQILADHGADVIKVEPPQGDDTREWGPPFHEDYTGFFSGANRNKRGISLDLRVDEGRAVLKRLLADADVLIENFKPGSMAKWDLGYDDLAEQFPRLVICSITGYGEDGPMGGFPGYDTLVQAWSGMMAINGTPDSGPVRLPVPLIDLSTGANAATGILAALRERDRSGLGQHIQIALYDIGVSMQYPHAAGMLLGGKAPKRSGNTHPNVSPYSLFPTTGRDMFIAVGNNRQFFRLCDVLDRKDLAEDPRYQTMSGRLENREGLIAALEDSIAKEDGESLSLKLMQAGVPSGPIQELEDVLEHPHTLHREMVVEVDGVKGIGIPVKLSRTPGTVRSAPPRFSEHSDDVLSEAGYSDAEIKALNESGIVPKTRG